MKQYFVTFDAAGRVEGAGFGIPPEGAVIMGEDLSVSELIHLYVDGENGLVPRPSTPSPTLDGDSLSLPAGPEGTRLRVIDRVSGEAMWEETTDATLTAHVLTLPDPGTYVVDIEPPFPWLPQQTEFVK